MKNQNLLDLPKQPTIFLFLHIHNLHLFNHNNLDFHNHLSLEVVELLLEDLIHKEEE